MALNGNFIWRQAKHLSYFGDHTAQGVGGFINIIKKLEIRQIEDFDDQPLVRQTGYDVAQQQIANHGLTRFCRERLLQIFHRVRALAV